MQVDSGKTLEPPPLPTQLLEMWPVIATGALAWLVAAVAAFAVPALETWRPVTLAGLGVGLLGTGIFLWQRNAARHGARGAQTGLNPQQNSISPGRRYASMAAPLLQAQIDINAPVSKVWALVSDFRRMPQWSPQCRRMQPLGPLRQGTRTLNLNRRNYLFWPTTCTVTEVVPDQKLAFRVNTNGTIWSYELQPIPDGTRVIESRLAENGINPVPNMTINTLFGGTANFEQELVDGMKTSLAKIKAAAENS